ncbi:MAG: serine hydrolase [Bacteroidota bacterium]
MYQKLTPFIAAFLLSGMSLSQGNDPGVKKVDKLFEKYISPDKPGAAVVVIKDGQVVHKNTFGLADYENQVPISTSTVFDIASVSKQFVGYAIAVLEKEGKLNLNDDVRNYIPEFSDFGHTITIGHLLYHQSGLRDWVSIMKLAGVGFNDVLTFEQILNMVYRQEALNFVPGTRHIYSNTGYNVLVEVVQRITDQTFRAWTKERIFQPLGMNNTFFKDRFNESIPNATKSYFKESEKNYKEVDALFLSTNGLTALGSSSLQTTIDDFALWLLHLDSEAAKDLVAKMQIPGKLTTDEPANYAYGLEVDTYNGLKRIYHDGDWASYSSYMAYFPDQHFSVAVLMNYVNWAEGFAMAAADAYLEDQFVEEEEELSFYDEPKPEILETLDLDLSRYAGIYYLEKYVVHLTITEKEGKLYVRATGEDKELMQPVSTSRFWVDGYDTSVYFNLDESGNVESVSYHRSLCPRRDPIPSNDQLKLSDYEGHYYSRELNTAYQVILKEGQLHLSHIRNGMIPLDQVWKDGFTNETSYAPLLDFRRNENGEITSFAVSNNRSRNQVFNKVDWGN